MSKIHEKISAVEGYITSIIENLPENVEKYKSDDIIRRASERYFEMIIEGLIDIAFMFISKKKFRIPEDDIDAFRILKEKKIINESLYKRLKLAKGMRNFIVHQYGKIDDELVYEAIRDDLEKDAKEFLKRIK